MDQTLTPAGVHACISSWTRCPMRPWHELQLLDASGTPCNACAARKAPLTLDDALALNQQVNAALTTGAW